jgi:hypothetical protein
LKTEIGYQASTPRISEPFAGRHDAAHAVSAGGEDGPCAAVGNEDFHDGIVVDLTNCHRRFVEDLRQLVDNLLAGAAHVHRQHVDLHGMRSGVLRLGGNGVRVELRGSQRSRSDHDGCGCGGNGDRKACHDCFSLSVPAGPSCPFCSRPPVCLRVHRGA